MTVGRLEELIAEDIKWDKLPNQFVLKTNHDSGNNGVFICKDKTKLEKESKRKRELVEKKLKAEELKKEIQQKGKIKSNSKFDWVLSKRE